MTGTTTHAPVDLDEAHSDQLARIMADLERFGLCIVIGAADGDEEQPGALQFVQQPHPREVGVLARDLGDLEPGDVLHRATLLDPAVDTRRLRMNNGCTIWTNNSGQSIHTYDE